jgi:hypothetical protein
MSTVCVTLRKGRKTKRVIMRCNPPKSPLQIQRIDEIMEPTAHAGRGDEEYGDPKSDDHGIVWSGDPEMSDEDNAAGAVYDVLKREGAVHPSASHYDSHMWYSTETETNWHDGTVHTQSYFLKGSEAFKRAVAAEFVRQRLGRIHFSNPRRNPKTTWTGPSTSSQWDDVIRYATTAKEKARLQKRKKAWQKKHPDFYQRMSKHRWDVMFSR